jgi:hypothetical protein
MNSGATSATTSVEDVTGNATAGAQALPGFTVQIPLGLAGLYVATTTLTDNTGAPIRRLRKTVGLGGQQAGDSTALGPPPQVTVNTTSLSGKFNFNASVPDKVTFNGSIQLPKGFSLSLPGVDTLEFSIGNVIDILMLDSKGNSKAGARHRVKSYKLKLPKLTGGVAQGGEVAKLSAQFNASALVAAGFDTEGITTNLAPNETKLHVKLLPRFVQVNLLYAGIAYESLVPVSYQLGGNNAFGTISGR